MEEFALAARNLWSLYAGMDPVQRQQLLGEYEDYGDVDNAGGAIAALMGAAENLAGLEFTEPNDPDLTETDFVPL